MYAIALFDAIKSTEHEYLFAGKTQLHSISEIDIDEDKLIDEDFFSFEAKKMKISFIDTGDNFCSTMKGYLTTTDYLQFNVPITLEGVTSVPSNSSYLNRKIALFKEVSGLTDYSLQVPLFVGIIDFSSLNIDFEQKSYSFEIVSISYILFENIDKLDSIMFISYLLNDVLSKPFEGVKSALVMIQYILDFITINGIIISESLEDVQNYFVTEIPDTDNQYLDLTEDNLCLYRKDNSFAEELLVKYTDYSLEQFNYSEIELFKTINDPLAFKKNIIATYYQFAFTKTAITINLHYRDMNATPFSVLTIIIPFISNRVISIEAFNPSVYLDEDKTLSLMDLQQYIFFTDENHEYIYNNKYELNSFVYNTNSLKEIVSLDILIISKGSNSPNTVAMHNYYSTYITQKINEMKTLPVSPPIDTFEYTNVLTGSVFKYKIKRNIMAVYFSGRIAIDIKIKSKLNSDGTCSLINTSTAILNPEKFDIREMLKTLLLLSGTYLKMKYIAGYKTCFEFSKKYIDSSETFQQIEPKYILNLSAKQAHIELNKVFDELDYSETDMHYLLRALVFKYKSISGELQKTYNCEIFKTIITETYGFMLGKNISITINGINIFGFINSLKEEEDTYSLEIICYDPSVTNTI